jgi:hypothetical protein
VKLAVAQPVTIGGVIAIAAGTPVSGQVVRVSDNRLLDRSGKLGIRVSTVRAGQQGIAVRGEPNIEGRPGTLNSVGAGVVFLTPAILIRGKDVMLPAGTIFDVYVDKEVSIGASEPMGVTLGASASPLLESNFIRAIDPNGALTP